MATMYRSTVVLAALVAAWGWSSMTQFVSAAGSDAAKGKSIYQAKCVTCHGPAGKGDGPIGKQLKPPAGDFTSAESKKKSDAELLDVIQNGKPKTAMVAWKSQLSEAEIQDLLAYVLTLRK
ncbi:MAG: cytochrome c [Nitrospirales bacterium]|nr:cytochrome c [Nitrospirales bacterium]QOJ35421.1 MAG: cytochrome c [Nitrospira sp.]